MPPIEDPITPPEDPLPPTEPPEGDPTPVPVDPPGTGDIVEPPWSIDPGDPSTPPDTTCHLLATVAPVVYPNGEVFPGAHIYEVFGFGARGAVMPGDFSYILGTPAVDPIEAAGSDTVTVPLGRDVEPSWALVIVPTRPAGGGSPLFNPLMVWSAWRQTPDINRGDLQKALGWWSRLAASVPLADRPRHIVWWDSEESASWSCLAPIAAIYQDIQTLFDATFTTMFTTQDMPRSLPDYLTRDYAHTPTSNGAKVVTLYDADGVVDTCHNPLTANVVGDGTGQIELAVNGSNTMASGVVGDPVTLRVMPDQRYPYPASGYVDHGDGSEQNWSAQVLGGVWAGTKTFDEAGTYKLRAVQQTPWGEVRSNYVTVHIAPEAATDGALIMVNNSVGMVNVTVGAAAALKVIHNTAYASPYTGTVYHGDGTTQAWTVVAPNPSWTGSKTWSAVGTYEVTVDLTRSGTDPIPGNTVIVNVLPAAPTDDPPTVTWVEPLGGGTITRKARLEVEATDDRRIDRVEFFADGAYIGTVYTPYDGADGYYMDWDTRSQANGQYTLQAVAYDSAGQYDSDSIVVSIANALADSTKIWTATKQSYGGNTIKALEALVDVAPPATPETTYRLDVTAHTPGDVLPTVENLGIDFCHLPLRKRIALTAPRSISDETGNGVLLEANQVRLALYLTPMLSLLEHQTNSEKVVALVAVRGDVASLTERQPSSGLNPESGYTGIPTVQDSGDAGDDESDELTDEEKDQIAQWLSEGRIYALTQSPHKILRLSDANAFEVVWDFGKAYETWADTAGVRSDPPLTNSWYGATGASTVEGYPYWGPEQDPDDWVPVDMAPMGDKLLVAMNAVDGSRGIILVLDTTAFPEDPAEAAAAYYLADPDKMPYYISLAPFGPLSIDAVETERPKLGTKASMEQRIIGDVGSMADFLTGLGENPGETKAWFGGARATGGIVLRWDGSNLSIVTTALPEVTALYSDEGWPDTGSETPALGAEGFDAFFGAFFGAPGSSTEATLQYSDTLWVGTKAGRVYRIDGDTVTLELETGADSITAIRRFAYDFSADELKRIGTVPNFAIDRQGDGYLYVLADDGTIWRRNHEDNAENAWVLVRTLTSPAYATGLGLYRSMWFSGSVFVGGPGSTQVHRWDQTEWARALTLDPLKATGVLCFGKNFSRRLFVGTEVEGRIWEVHLAEADIATEGVQGVALHILETG